MIYIVRSFIIPEKKGSSTTLDIHSHIMMIQDVILAMVWQVSIKGHLYTTSTFAYNLNVPNQSQICFYLFCDNCNSSILEVTYKQAWIIFYLLLKSSKIASNAVKALPWLVRIKGHMRMTFCRQTLMSVWRRKVVFIRLQNCIDLAPI